MACLLRLLLTNKVYHGFDNQYSSSAGRRDRNCRQHPSRASWCTDWMGRHAYAVYMGPWHQYGRRSDVDASSRHMGNNRRSRVSYRLFRADVLYQADWRQQIRRKGSDGRTYNRYFPHPSRYDSRIFPRRLSFRVVLGQEICFRRTEVGCGFLPRLPSRHRTKNHCLSLHLLADYRLSDLTTISTAILLWSKSLYQPMKYRNHVLPFGGTWFLYFVDFHGVALHRDVPS